MSKFYKTHPAPTGRFVPPQTPFLQQTTASINSNVINEAQQYEQGLKESTEPDAGAISSDQSAPVDANPVVSAPQPAPIIAPPPASSMDYPAALQPSPGTARSSSHEEAPPLEGAGSTREHAADQKLVPKAELRPEIKTAPTQESNQETRQTPHPERLVPAATVPTLRPALVEPEAHGTPQPAPAATEWGNSTSQPSTPVSIPSPER